MKKIYKKLDRSRKYRYYVGSKRISSKAFHSYRQVVAEIYQKKEKSYSGLTYNKLKKLKPLKKSGRFVFDIEIKGIVNKKKKVFRLNGTSLPNSKKGWNKAIMNEYFSTLQAGNVFFGSGKSMLRFRFAKKKPIKNIRVNLIVRKVK